MDEYLASLVADDAAEARRAIASQGRVTQRYGPRVLVFEAWADVAGRQGVAAWHQRHDPAFRAATSTRAGDGLTWDGSPGEAPEGRPQQ